MASLPEDLIAKFKNIINQRTGLYFKDYALKDLEAAVLQRMAAHKTNSAVSYYNMLVMSEKKEDEFRELLNILTVNHTYFFRNEPQFKILKEKILPALINRRSLFTRPEALINNAGRPTIRIWSAGCSTGEEPYSIAILIKEMIPDIENWDIQIIATDASESVLAKARKGVYSKNSIEHVATEYMDKYFQEEQLSGHTKQYLISPAIKNMVNFAFFNLMDHDYPQGFDIIFCRNVVIYFDMDTTIKVMQNMHSSLYDEGYFFIGYSETLQFMPDRFKMFAEDEAIYYCKAGIQEPAFTAPEIKETSLEQALEEISIKELQAELLAEKKAKDIPVKLEEMLVEAVKLSHLKEYDKALSILECARSKDKNMPDIYYLTAEILVNQGKLVKAKEVLRQLLAINSFFSPAYFLMGCVYIDENTIDKAKESLKKAIYIDKDFPIAHFYIAQAYKNEGKIDDAIREYRNTSKMLSKAPPEGIIPYSGGFNAATLMSVCRDNIERLKTDIH